MNTKDMHPCWHKATAEWQDGGSHQGIILALLVAHSPTKTRMSMLPQSIQLDDMTRQQMSIPEPALHLLGLDKDKPAWTRIPASDTACCLKQVGTVATNLRKTKFCRNVQQQGWCKYGEKCDFAHTVAELRIRPDYKKSKLCAYFAAKGRCKAGDRCRFAHGMEELRPVSPLKERLGVPPHALVAASQPMPPQVGAVVQQPATQFLPPPGLTPPMPTPPRSTALLQTSPPNPFKLMLKQAPSVPSGRSPMPEQSATTLEEELLALTEARARIVLSF